MPSPERHAAGDAFARPVGIGGVEDVPDAAGREALARLGRLARQQREQVGIMLVVLDLIVRPAADRVAKIGEILQQQRHRVGFGLRQRAC